MDAASPAITILRTRTELREALAAAPHPVGLIPTMGWLHAGHVSLIERARAECATVVVSIFVNPRQFNRPADLAAYPRNEARDVAKSGAAGADLVWAPGVDDVYPQGFETAVHVGALATPLEGAARPGHFDGVTTVVAVLFGLIRPDRAYFGEKDAQQVRIVERMARDLGLTEVIRCGTVREHDGLAMSSRNVHLDPGDRVAAAVLSRALFAGRAAHEAGERSADAIRSIVRAVLATEPRVTVEYISVADDADLAELDLVDRPAVLSLAAQVGPTRLIDNVPLG